MRESKTLDQQDTIPFYPNHASTEIKVMVAMTVIAVIIGILGLMDPVDLGAPADPMDTPAHVKPEWYFLALYQLLKYIPKTAGVIIPIVLLGLITLWPFLDRKPDASRRPQRIRFAVIAAGMLILIALTIWGEVS